MKKSYKSYIPTALAALLTLAAIPASAQTAQTLYATNTTGAFSARDNYGSPVGCQFEVGSSNVVVSHLGFFSTNTATGLAVSHSVGVFTGTFAAGGGASGMQVLGQVTVPAGTAADWYTNGFYYVHLNPPLLLSSNTVYGLFATVTSGDGDKWSDDYSPPWNTYFTGANGKKFALYSSGGYPPTGASQNGSNDVYGAPSLANIQIGQAYAGVQTTNISLASGATLTIAGFASGAPTINYLWYSNNIALANQTSPTLVIPNVTPSASGTYFFTASNSLGGEQSANVTVLVTAYPVVITTQPTNLTVFANYQANFYTTATGTPPISYQWSTNGTSISGATGTNYSLTAALSNSGEVFSVLASNDIAGTPYTAQSSNATLTVLPNQAPPQELLHGDVLGLDNNTYQGQQGGLFTVGSTPVVVTALGYYAWPANRTTNGSSVTCSVSTDHHVGIYSTNGVGNAPGTYVPVSNLLCSVDVPSGSNPVIGGYMWVQLNPAVLLSSNTTYLLVAETKSDTDWGDTYLVPDLNPSFASSCSAVYGGNGWGSSAYLGGEYSGQMYSAPNMAILTNSTPVADILPTNVMVYAGANATLTAYVAGQPPVTLQWYTNGVPLAGQTNLTLVLTNLQVAQSSSNYYVFANSPGGNVQSANGSVTVLSDSPTFVQNVQPLSQSAFNYQTVQFSALAEGLGTLSYQWYFSSSPISGATNSTLILTDVSSNSVGTYYLIVTNIYGKATSSNATLAVEYPAAPGTYPSVVMGPNLLLYYPLNDVGDTGNVATNWGAAGFAYDGSYVGGCSPVAGPPQVNWPNNNNAVSLDGSSGYVELPPVTGVVVSNITIAAWVNDPYPEQNYPASGGQYQNAAIFFQRSTYVFGLAVDPDPTNGDDALRYTWNGTGFNNFTGLDLPTNQWALATMVISPTNSAVYLQYSSVLLSTNFAASNPSAAFTGNSYIGWDTAGSLDGTNPRLWTGPIADVMVFSQALSPTAINALYYGIAPSPSITLTISPVANSQLTVTWSGGTLLEATNLLGPWMSVPGEGNSSGSYTTEPSNNAEFYGVQQ